MASTQQRKIPSGFGAKTTAAEVMQGVDLTGRLAVVTGGYSGTGYEKWTAYGQAKTANSLFAVHLDKLGSDAGVRAFAVHPGGILTPLQRHLTHEEMVGYGWIDEDGNPRDGFKTPEQGAATSLWCATSPQLDGLGGLYCEDCDVAELVPASETDRLGGVRTYAVDPDEAERLWELSAGLTGVDAFAAAQGAPANVNGGWVRGWGGVSVQYSAPPKRLCGNPLLLVVSAQSIHRCAQLCGNPTPARRAGADHLPTQPQLTLSRR